MKKEEQNDTRQDLNPAVYFTDRSKAVVPVLVLLFVASWFILRGDLFYVLPCVILFFFFFFFFFFSRSVFRLTTLYFSTKHCVCDKISKTPYKV